MNVNVKNTKNIILIDGVLRYKFDGTDSIVLHLIQEEYKNVWSEGWSMSVDNRPRAYKIWCHWDKIR